MKTKIQQITLLALLGAAVVTAQQSNAQVTTWTGAGADQNWSTPGNWSTSGGSTPPGTGDTVVFGAGAAPASASSAGVVDSIIDTSRTIAGLQYINTTATASFHTTQINDNQTLTLNGTFSAGVGGQATTAGMTGNGNFIVNNTTGNFNVGGAGISTATVTFTLGNGVNTLNVATLSIGESASNNGRQNILNLGGGPTIINADNLNLGTGKGQGTIQWVDPTFTNSLTIRNHLGTGRANLLLGNGTSGSGSSNGKLLATGHPVDILANNFVLGRLGNDTGGQQGTLAFDWGTVDTTSMYMELIPAAGAGTGTANGSVLTVGGNPTNTATLIVNAAGGGLFIVSGSSNSAAGRTSSGTFNLLTNGVTTVNCSIIKAAAVNNTATINLSGTLNMQAATNTVGTRLAPIDNVTLDFATLNFLEDGSSLNLSAVNLTINDTNTVNILALPPIIHLPTSIPIMTYTTLNSQLNIGLGTMPGDYVGHLADDGLGTISLVITGGTVVVAKNDIWTGLVNNNWDTTTLNWTNASLSITNYTEADFVTFNDIAATGNVTLLGNQHTPGSVTFNNSAVSYVLSGAGKISGSTGLTKSGAGSVTLSESGGDNFSGGILVHGGTLILDNAGSAIAGGLTNDVNTVVQIGNNDAFGTLPVGGLDIEGILAYARSDSFTLPTAIVGGGSLVQKGAGTLTLGGSSTYSGNTIVSNGVLAINSLGTVATPLISVRNATLDLSQTASQGSFNAVTLTNGTLRIGTNTTFFAFGTVAATNSTIVINADVFGSATINVTTLQAGGISNNITIPSIANLTLTPTLPTIIPLLTYSSFSGSFNFGLSVPTGVSGYISNNVSALTVQLVITNAPQTLTWNGGSGTGNNWSDAANWTGVAINSLDALNFDGIVRTNNNNDTAAGTQYSGVTFAATAGPFTLSGNSINLGGTMVNNSATDQKVNLGLAMSGGTATLDGGQAGGTLVFNGAITNSSTNATTTIVALDNGTIGDLWQSTNGGQLEIQMNNGGIWSVVDGTGTGAQVQVGRGRLHVAPAASGELDFGTTNSAPNVDLGFSTNGNVTIEGATLGTLAINNGTLKANSFNAANNGTSHSVFNMNGGSLVIGSGGFVAGGGNGGGSLAMTITNGSIYVTNGGQFTFAQRSPSTITQSGGLLQVGSLLLASGQTIGGNGTYTLSGGTLNVTNITVGRDGANAFGIVNYNGGTLKLSASSTALFSQVNLAGLTNIVQSGGAVFDTAGFNSAVNLPLITDPNLGGQQDGGLVKNGAGILTLNAPNTYNGSNIVNGGTLFLTTAVLSDVTVNPAGTLAGTSSVGGQVTASGTVAPGTTNNTGVLTVVSNVTFTSTGTAFMKLKKGSLTNDVLAVTDSSGTITYAGTLSLTNISGSLAANDSFHLFSAPHYAGTFASIVPSSPGPGLTWNTANLAVNGTLSIVGGATPTTNANILSVKLSGNTIQIHGTNNNGGQTFHYTVYSSTNVALPLSSWTPVVTNSFNADGTFDFTDTVLPSQPRLFYDVKAVP